MDSGKFAYSGLEGLWRGPRNVFRISKPRFTRTIKFAHNIQNTGLQKKLFTEKLKNNAAAVIVPNPGNAIIKRRDYSLLNALVWFSCPS